MCIHQPDLRQWLHALLCRNDILFSVQIIAYRACVVLLDDFDHDRTVRLRFFADKFVLRPVPVQRGLVLLNLFFDQLHCVIVSKIILYDRYKRLSLVSFRFSSSSKKIKRADSNRIYAVRTPHVVYKV